MNVEKVGAFLFVAMLIGGMNLATTSAEDTTNEKPVVVAAASNLGYFAKEVGGEKIEVHSIVPPGACPGHYDQTPKDIETVSKADLMLWNGFEPWLKDLVKNSGNENVRMEKFGMLGPWGIPPNGKKYVAKVSEVLSSEFPEYAEAFEKNENKLASAITSRSEDLKESAREAEIENVKVVCRDVQSGFVEWLGFNVVETYPSPEQLSAKRALEITREAENCALVVSNNASGVDFGDGVAKETVAKHAVLVNFPGATEETEDYVEMITHNAEVLIEKKNEFESEGSTLGRTEKDLKNVKLQRNIFLGALIISVAVAAVEAIIIRRR